MARSKREAKRKTKPKDRRIARERHSLRCRACGGGNPVSAASLESGWFCCTHCDTPVAVEGRGDFAIEGPAGRVTRVVRPGSSEFETASDLILGLGSVLLAVIGADLAFEAARWGLARAAVTPPPLLAPVFYTWLAVCGALGFAATFTRQRLEVRPDSIDLWWITGALRWRHRRIRTERFHTSAILRGRTGVEVRVPRRRIFVHMQGHESIRWLEREIVAAVKDARRPDSGDRVPCPGCGGPVAHEKELRDSGGIDCPHCGTGLVQTGGGIAMPPARVGHSLHAEGSGELPAPRRTGDTLEWTVGPWAHRYPLGSVGCVLISLCLNAGLLAGGLLVVVKVPGLRSLVAMIAVALNVGYLVQWPKFLAWMYGRHHFRLEPTLLVHEIRIGPWCYRRLCAPLARLVELSAAVEIFQNDAAQKLNTLQIHVRTATQKLDSEVYDRVNAPVVRAVVEAVPERLRALGRSVGKLRR